MYERIEKLRKERGLSQGALERELGFSNGSYSKWKTSVPTPDRLQKLADYFGVSIKWLLLGEEDTKNYCLDDEAIELAQDIFNNKELRMLFDVQRNLNKNDLRALYNVALALTRKERGNID